MQRNSQVGKSLVNGNSYVNAQITDMKIDDYNQQVTTADGRIVTATDPEKKDLVFSITTTAFAADDPLAVVNNFSEFIFGLIRAIGIILLAFGIVQVGLSLKSHDPSQRANGFLTLAGGIIITFTKEILTLITG